MFQFRYYSVSTLLIALAFVFTLTSLINPQVFLFWMNGYFFERWMYHYWILQFFSSQLIHGGLLHLLMNSIFILYFWNILELYLWSKKTLMFFICNSVFLWIIITFFGSANTVGISGFVLAILSYYTLLLYSQKNPEYQWGITAIVINVLIWLSPGISLLGHLGWTIFWGFFYWITKKK